MPFQSKNCLQCGATLTVKSTRDVTRKKFCSHSCRQRWRFANGEFTWLDRFITAGNTPESNAKKSMPGAEHPLYKADRTEIKSKRPRFEQTQWTKAVFERDDYTCKFCGARGVRLQADHILPYCAFPEIRWDVNNGRTLCVDCHKKTPTYAGKARVFVSRSNQNLK